MSYVIFEIKSTEVGKIQTLLQDDIVNRQSIVIRNANSVEMKGTASYLKVEGSPEGLKRAEELAKELEMKKLPDKKAKKIDEKIKEQEDSAATGMGMIFELTCQSSQYPPNSFFILLMIALTSVFPFTGSSNWSGRAIMSDLRQEAFTIHCKLYPPSKVQTIFG